MFGSGAVRKRKKPAPKRGLKSKANDGRYRSSIPHLMGKRETLGLPGL
jgi:hypothetical protein